MNYISIGIETLSTPAFLGSADDLCGAWLKLIRFCAQSENGGRIEGARLWDERLWLITCGLSLEILKKESALWLWDQDSLVVQHYPVWSELKVKRSREGAATTNSKRWGAKKEAPTQTASRIATQTASRSPSRDRSFVRSFVRSKVLKGGKKNAATPSKPDLKTQWAATRAEIKRLEELEGEQDGNLSAADVQELSRLRKQLADITRQQTGGKP